jgi:hypothetical protein
MKASDYWREVCAPKLKARKDELGRTVPEREIAAAVEAASGKRTGRAALGHILSGEREPYISQFVALCQKLELDPLTVLQSVAPSRRSAIQGMSSGFSHQKSDKTHTTKSRRG